LETQNILAGEGKVTLMPQGNDLLKQMLGAESTKE